MQNCVCPPRSLTPPPHPSHSFRTLHDSRLDCFSNISEIGESYRQMQPSVLSPTNLAGRAASGPGGPAAAVLVAAQGRAQSHLTHENRFSRAKKQSHASADQQREEENGRGGGGGCKRKFRARCRILQRILQRALNPRATPSLNPKVHPRVSSVAESTLARAQHSQTAPQGLLELARCPALLTAGLGAGDDLLQQLLRLVKEAAIVRRTVVCGTVCKHACVHVSARERASACVRVRTCARMSNPA